MHYAMLLQDTTPDTSSYMIAGYVIFAVLMAIYVISVLARRRNLERDLTTLETMQAESKVARSSSASRKRATPKAAPAKSGGRGASRKRATKRK